MHDRCWFDRGALAALFAEAGRWRFRETGGALLGWRSDDGPVVARILGPGPKARHRWSSFEPDGKWQNEQGQAIYSATGGRIAYLGDWHTHPRGSGQPSAQDRKTAHMIAGDRDFRAPKPLYAIAHPTKTRDVPWSLEIYEVDAVFRKLAPVEFAWSAPPPFQVVRD